mmetsp:Transcript_39315/g.60072  ORF Transcript_39315/g.60072 Transcript_39315/m.60072 type:complete len:84 (-) Transcript_39315:1729-1980(-)
MGETNILSARTSRANTAREVHRLKYTGNLKNNFKTILVHGQPAAKKKSMGDKSLQTLLTKRKKSNGIFEANKRSLATVSSKAS